MPIKLQRFFLMVAYAIPLALIFGRASADILTGVVSIGFIIHSIITRNFSWLCKPWVRWAILTWLYLILDGMLAMYDVRIAVQRGLEWGRWPLFAIAFGTWLLPLDPKLKMLRQFLLALLPLIAIDVLIQFFTGHDVFGFPRSRYMGRLTGPFGKEVVIVGNYLNRLSWPAIGLVFSAILSRMDCAKLKTRFWLLVPLAYASLLGIAIFVTGERMAALLFALCSGIFLVGARKFRRLIFVACSICAVVMVSLVLIRPDLQARFITVTKPVMENFDQSSYGAIFENALMTWKTSPIVGVGPKNFLAACEAKGAAGGFRDEAAWSGKFSCARHPHNPYLEWLAETGIIGFGFFLGLIFLWARMVRRNLQQIQPLSCYYIALGFAIGLVPFLWPLMASTSFFINWSAILFWWVLGLNIGFDKRRESCEIAVQTPETTVTAAI